MRQQDETMLPRGKTQAKEDKILLGENTINKKVKYYDHQEKKHRQQEDKILIREKAPSTSG